MPIYEFTCRTCDERFEELVSASANGHTVACPECGSNEPMRMLSAFAVGTAASKSAAGPASNGGGGCCGGACGCG